MMMHGTRRVFLVENLHWWVLLSFGVAQPLFDLLSWSPEFFVARLSQPKDILALVVGLSILVPGIFVLVLWSISQLSWSAYVVCQRVLVGGFSATLVLLACQQVTSLPGGVLVIGAAMIGSGATYGYHRFPPVRLFLTFLSPAVVVFPVLFLFFSPVSKLIIMKPEVVLSPPKISAAFPIVLVVFDEFPLVALMDETEQIDAVRYPHFAAFAKEATWFRNATTVSDDTLVSLPNILTGRYPDRALLPAVADHPYNLFTLLGSAYEMQVHEARTQLCPERLCGFALVAFGTRMRSLLKDVLVVYLHLLLPQEWRAWLPSISTDWLNFERTPARVENDTRKIHRPKSAFHQLDRTKPIQRPNEVFRFIEAIDSTDEPAFYFLHTLLPHTPYMWLPSGKRYPASGNPPGLISEKWPSDEWAVIQAYQRVLLQIAYVDTLLGALLDRLKQHGLYEQALIIITSDHGASFRPNDSRRLLTDTNSGDILAIPLFIKSPYQSEGRVSERNVETIDIVPTIADVLDITVPWPIDGGSVFDTTRPERPHKTFFPRTDAQRSFPASLDAWRTPLIRQLALFGSGKTRPGWVFPAGPLTHLIGQPTTQVPIRNVENVAIRMDPLSPHFDALAPVVPAYVTGQLRSGREVGTPHPLAVVINGTIQAVTQPWTFPLLGQHGRWGALVDETSFHSGANEVEVFLVTNEGHTTTLLRPVGAFQNLPPYDPGSGEVLLSPQG